jgi:phospholipid/cholesterol/gamma-HCH transport system substrate-binding protein
MPRTRSLAWSELKIGVLTITAIVITALTIFFLTGDRGFFWERYSLKARFASIPGLKAGSPVRVAGLEVGAVTNVVLAGEQVEVTFEVSQDVRERITTSSVATLGSVSLLGESAVDITASASGTPIPEWGYVPQGRAAAQLTDLANEVGEGVENLSNLVADIRAGRGTVGKLMTDEQLYAELNRFAVSARTLTDSLRSDRGTIGRLMNDRRAAESLEAALGNLQTLTARINAGEGSIGKLLNDDAFSRSLTSATANFDALGARINKGEGTMGKLVTDPALFDKLNSMSGRLDELMLRLNQGDGTAGRLLKDAALYENMNKVTTDISSLIEAIKKDPRKYLTVRVSIF